MVGGPLRQVLAAFEHGAGSLAEVEQATGLSRDVVDAAVEHLVRSGRLESRELTVGCPPGSCGKCADTESCAPGPSRHRGPALVALTLPRQR